MRETAWLLKISAAKVSEVRRMSATWQVCIPDRPTSIRANEESVLRTRLPPTWLMVADVGYC